jgi:hypothetical protein
VLPLPAPVETRCRTTLQIPAAAESLASCALLLLPSPLSFLFAVGEVYRLWNFALCTTRMLTQLREYGEWTVLMAVQALKQTLSLVLKCYEVVLMTSIQTYQLGECQPLFGA